MHLLDAPPLGDEAVRQPIEQLRVARRLALDAEVLRGLHQAGAEGELPEAVDGDAGGEGVVRADEPAREGEAVSGLAGRQGREDGGGAGGDFLPLLVVLPADHHEGVARHREPLELPSLHGRDVYLPLVVSGRTTAFAIAQEIFPRVLYVNPRQALGEARLKAYLAVKHAEWEAMKDYGLEEEVKLLAERY